MNIIPFIGIDNWVFGMRQDQIRSELGLHFEESRVALAGTKENFMDYYPSLSVRMHFDEGHLLTFIEVLEVNSSLILRGVDIGKMSGEALIDLLSKEDDAIEFEEEEFISHGVGIGRRLPSDHNNPIETLFAFPKNYYKAPAPEQIQNIIDYYLKLAREG